VQPKVLLRIAAGAMLLFALGHTFGGMIFSESHGPEEDALMASLAAYHFDIMGSSRSHHDFYTGEGWYLSATLVAMIAVCWLLSSATLESPGLVRCLSLVLALFFATSAGLCAAFFFAAPLLMSVIASAACAGAWWRLRSARAASL
jgi:hypothetical protein